MLSILQSTCAKAHYRDFFEEKKFFYMISDLERQFVGWFCQICSQRVQENILSETNFFLKKNVALIIFGFWAKICWLVLSNLHSTRLEYFRGKNSRFFKFFWNNFCLRCWQITGQKGTYWKKDFSFIKYVSTKSYTQYFTKRNLSYDLYSGRV